MFRYLVSTGELYECGELIGRGYSGVLGPCRDNPDCEGQSAQGPIPCGLWRMTVAKPVERFTAPVIRLLPWQHTARGRTGFLIHGDNKAGDASTGCIVMGFATRVRVAEAVRAGRSLLTVERAGIPPSLLSQR